MFKVGDKVVRTLIDDYWSSITDNPYGIHEIVKVMGDSILLKDTNNYCLGFNFELARYSLKYAVIDCQTEDVKLFEYHKEALDFINNTQINPGDKWKHSDGTIVEVRSIADNMVNFKFEAFNVSHNSYLSTDKFLREFKKCLK
ncbi:hypothetical protein [Proteus phage vB_PmiP_RS10pmA]|nr:hypothetical protein [Proteus phage vB_PmiP_RS10pmA]